MTLRAGTVVFVLVLLLVGCRQPGDERFIPSEEAAQRTLETALSAWRDGKEPPCIASDQTPVIQLIDTQHHKQKLVAFSILGPTTGDAKRCYAVRLTFDTPPREVRARYVIAGLDPLWVIRYEDFEMIAHWSHPMGPAPGEKKPPSGAQGPQ